MLDLAGVEDHDNPTPSLGKSLLRGDRGGVAYLREGHIYKLITDRKLYRLNLLDKSIMIDDDVALPLSDATDINPQYLTPLIRVRGAGAVRREDDWYLTFLRSVTQYHHSGMLGNSF